MADVGATKSQAYDHPAYEIPIFIGGVSSASATVPQGRFSAFTAMVLKSATITILAAGTNTNTIVYTRVSAAGTATTTLGSVIWGTGNSGTSTLTRLSTASGQTVTFSLGTSTIATGDVVGFLSNLDATGTYAYGVEAYLVPGANLTV